MGQGRAAACGTAIVIAIGGVLASMAFAGGGRSVESEPFETQGNTISTGSVKCAKGSTQTGGGFRIEPKDSSDIGTRVIASRLSGGRGWAVQIDTLGGGKRDARAIVACQKNAPYLARESVLEVVDGSVFQFNTVTAECPVGTSVAGGGGFVTGGHGDMYVLDSRPDGDRRWVVTTFTSDGYVGSHVAEAVCDAKGSHDYVTASKNTVDGRSAQRGIVLQRKATAKCPGRSVVTGGGFALENEPNRAIFDNRPKGDDAWLLRVRTYAPAETYTSYARCLKP